MFSIGEEETGSLTESHMLSVTYLPRTNQLARFLAVERKICSAMPRFPGLDGADSAVISTHTVQG